MKKILLIIMAFLTMNCAYADEQTDYRLHDMKSNMIDEGQQVGYKI